MLWSHFLFSPHGRITRRSYWLRFMLPIIILEMAIPVVVITYDKPMLILFVLSLWPLIAVGAKRCHDRNRSGWFQLAYLIPIMGPLWILFELGFLRGTIGPNRFGPDPLREG